jgi:hypothetical protein
MGCVLNFVSGDVRVSSHQEFIDSEQGLPFIDKQT